MTDLPPVTFPCQTVPADADRARLLGLYAQRQTGRWMQRTKILGGQLSAAEWRALAAIARRHTPGTPLHLTTRQDIELHDLSAEQVPDVQRALADAGLTGLGACGDTLRNVTVCPCSGLATGSADLHPLAWRLRRMLEAHEHIYSLPRKFKIALACGESCGQPWINDLALVACRRDGRWGLTVYGAGSLGARPRTGIRLFDWIPPEEAAPLTRATVEFFHAHGDRENRRRARLRHVRERLGDTEFAARLRAAFEQARADRPVEPVTLCEPDRDVQPVLDGRAVLNFANGNVSPEAAEALSVLAGSSSLCVRIANHHRVIVFAASDEAHRRAVDAHEALRSAAALRAAVVACPGSRWCSRALVNTNAPADRIRAELTDELPAGSTVCISGCPNGCGHTGVADVGLSGCLVSTDSGRQEAFDVRIAGGMGRDPRLARQTDRKVPAADVVDVLRTRLDQLAADGAGGSTMQDDRRPPQTRAAEDTQ